MIIINNKGNKKEKERERESEKAIMHYYSTVTSEIINVVIFTNHIFFVYILDKAKIQHYDIHFVFWDEINRIITHNL